MTLPIPCTLEGTKGRYEITSRLGQGGMSAGYVGTSNRGHDVVVKEAYGTDLAAAEERLRIEAQILQALRSPGHPRGVRCIDEGTNLAPFCLVEKVLTKP